METQFRLSLKYNQIFKSDTRSTIKALFYIKPTDARKRWQARFLLGSCSDRTCRQDSSITLNTIGTFQGSALHIVYSAIVYSYFLLLSIAQRSASTRASDRPTCEALSYISHSHGTFPSYELERTPRSTFRRRHSRRPRILTSPSQRTLADNRRLA